MSSEVFCRLRALRLLDPDLSAIKKEGEPEVSRLAREILALGDVDKPRVAGELAGQLLREDQNALEGLFRLARQLVVRRHGVPKCTDQSLWHRIAYEMDSDLVIAAELSLNSPPPKPPGTACSALAWPSVLAADGFMTELAPARELVDGHVHLGGALPGSFYWIALMSGFVPTDLVQRWRSTERGAELWSEKIRIAADFRKKLFRELFHRGHEQFMEAGLSPYWMEDLPPEPFVDYVLVMIEPDKKKRLRYNPILGERYLLWEALARICREKDLFWERGFLAYIQCRNSFIHHLAHRPGYRGLTRFQETFGRQDLLFIRRKNRNAKALARYERQRRRRQRINLSLERFRVRHALRYQFSDPTDAPWARDHGAGLPGRWPMEETPWRPARQVELRVSPQMNRAQVRTIHAHLLGVADFVSKNRDAPLLRVGFVFHLIREHDTQRLREKAEKHLNGLHAILQEYPHFRPFIVGIDLAGNEEATPPRELAFYYRQIPCRDRRQKMTPNCPPWRLKRTCHAGEDFCDLLSGLRYVDDSVNLFDLQPGERIGHGLALAIDPERWYPKQKTIHKPHAVHLIDLLWCRYIAQLFEPSSELERDGELDYLAKGFLNRFLVDNESKGMGTLGAADWQKTDRVIAHYADLEFAGDGTALFFDSEKKILEHLGMKWKDTMTQVPVSEGYIRLVSGVRRRVMRRVSRREVVIEACPTSNMLIGNFGAYEKLPYLNLNRAGLGKDQLIGDPVLLSINSDDPGNFKTTLANEYRLMGYGLQKMGYRPEEVLAWLERAREVGLASSFIPPWSPPTRFELLKTIWGMDRPGGIEDEEVYYRMGYYRKNGLLP